MLGGKQGDMFQAGQESQDCSDFISDVGIRGIYWSLALGTAKFKQLDVLLIFSDNNQNEAFINIFSYSCISEHFKDFFHGHGVKPGYL